MTEARFLELTERLNSINMPEFMELEKAYSEYAAIYRFEFELMSTGAFLEWVREERELILGTEERKQEIRKHRERSKHFADLRRNEMATMRNELADRAKETFVDIVVDDLNARLDPDRSDRIGCYKAHPTEIRFLLSLIKQLKSRP